MQFTKVQYENLNGKQQERYNYQQLSAKLAEYGFGTTLLEDDWNGADFIAVHFIDGTRILRVQQKGRCGIWKKYRNKNIWICFPDRTGQTVLWYLYPHDDFFNWIQVNDPKAIISKSWQKTNGCYHSISVRDKWKPFLGNFVL